MRRTTALEMLPPVLLYWTCIVSPVLVVFKQIKTNLYLYYFDLRRKKVQKTVETNVCFDRFMDFLCNLRLAKLITLILRVVSTLN